MDDLIRRQDALDAFGLSEKTRKYGGDHSGYDPMMLYEIQDVIEGLPSVNPQVNNEDIHREREQAYMKGYEDASKRYRAEPCEDKEYEKYLNELKEQILEEGDSLVSKLDLLERFVKIDNYYNNRPWNLLQILSNINILIGKEPCGDAISRADAIRVASGYCHWTNIPDELAKLPTVNPIPCGDVISRQAVLMELDKYLCGVPFDEKGIDEVIKELPTVSVKQKTPIDCSDSICRADAIKLVKSYIHEIITESGVDKNAHTNEILIDIVESLAF